MSERFKELPEEKQLSIMRAAADAFAEYEYKKASADLIACKAEFLRDCFFIIFMTKRFVFDSIRVCQTNNHGGSSRKRCIGLKC